MSRHIMTFFLLAGQIQQKTLYRAVLRSIISAIFSHLRASPPLYPVSSHLGGSLKRETSLLIKNESGALKEADKMVL